MPTANRIPDDLQHLLPLTPAVFSIVFALADGEKHCYAIMQTVSRISDNQFRMGPGTLYTTIQRLLDLGLIEETESAGGQSDHEKRRRYYKLTRTGKAALGEVFSAAVPLQLQTPIVVAISLALLSSFALFAAVIGAMTYVGHGK